ncbi:MAG TPA: SDR family NAD(P)-dependent oxidoreductase [Gammaproteobacteria bacterium]|nr:SDR family NAD(P)-dependent oxidoreductase [Gammaproteobacteria bacterium]
MDKQKIAVVTGANRGLGLEVARQLARQGIHVVLTARDRQAGAVALRTLESSRLPVELRKLDVTSSEDAQALARYLRESHGHVDILVNNAGILPDTPAPLATAPASILEALNTNTLGAVRLIQALAPLMPAGARIVNVSTGMAALHNMGGGDLAYRVSKTALNAVTRVFAAELAARHIGVNSVDPGWVKTDMGGSGATRSVERGAETIVWLASAADATETGGYWRDKRKLDW